MLKIQVNRVLARRTAGSEFFSHFGAGARVARRVLLNVITLETEVLGTKLDNCSAEEAHVLLDYYVKQRFDFSDVGTFSHNLSSLLREFVCLMRHDY